MTSRVPSGGGEGQREREDGERIRARVEAGELVARVQSDREHFVWAHDTLGASGMDGISAVNLSFLSIELCDAVLAHLASTTPPEGAPSPDDILNSALEMILIATDASDPVQIARDALALASATTKAGEEEVDLTLGNDQFFGDEQGSPSAEARQAELVLCRGILEHVPIEHRVPLFRAVSTLKAVSTTRPEAAPSSEGDINARQRSEATADEPPNDRVTPSGSLPDTATQGGEGIQEASKVGRDGGGSE